VGMSSLAGRFRGVSYSQRSTGDGVSGEPAVRFLAILVLLWKYHDKQKPHCTVLDLPGIVVLSFGSMALLALVSRLGPDGLGGPGMIA